MPQFLKYAGRCYRLAQEPIDKIDDANQPNVLAAADFLKTHGISNIEFSNYYGSPEGFQVSFTTKGWGNADAIIVLDFAKGKKPKLQDMTVTMCGNSLAASGALELQELIRALATLNKLQVKSGPSSFSELENINEHEQRKDAIIDWLLYGDKIGIAIADVGSAYEKEGIKFDHTKLSSMLTGINKLLQTKEGEEQQRAYTEIKTALSELTNQEWKELLKFRERLKAPFVPDRVLVQKYVQELTKHEDYQGEVHMLPNIGNIVNVAVGVAPPLDGLLFQFERAPGEQALKLHGMELRICATSFTFEKADNALARDVVSSAVDIMLASERAAVPETTQTRRQKTKEKKRPKKPEEKQELSKEEKQQIANYVFEGPAIWKVDDGYRVHDGGKVLGRFESNTDAEQVLREFLQNHPDEHYYYVIDPRKQSATAYTRQGEAVLTFPVMKG